MYQMMIGTYTKRGSEGIYLLEMDDILQQVRVISVIGEKNPPICVWIPRKNVCMLLWKTKLGKWLFTMLKIEKHRNLWGNMRQEGVQHAMCPCRWITSGFMHLTMKMDPLLYLKWEMLSEKAG